MIIGKKYLILAALVLALGAAVYLNWQFAPTEEIVGAGTQQIEDGSETEYVVNLTDSSSSDALAEDGGDAVTADKKPSEFDEAKSEREATRNQALDTLKDIVDDASASNAQKSSAIEAYTKLAENMEREASIELLIKAKGFENCVVVISESQVDVVVPSDVDGLNAAEVAIIRDIVMGQVNIPAANIKIIEIK